MNAFSSDVRAKRFALLFLFTCVLCTYSNLRAQTGYTSYLLADSASTASDLSIVVSNNDGFTIHAELGENVPNTWRKRYAFFLDSAGQVTLSRRWDGNPTPNTMKHSDVTRLPDGNFDAMLFGNGGGIISDLLAVKTDPIGNIIWSNFYTLDTLQVFDKEVLTARLPDNSYIITTQVKIISSNTTAHYYALRTDSAGNVLWSNGYGTFPLKIPTVSMDVTQNENILIAGYQYDNALQANVSQLIRVDKNGNLLWYNRYKYNQGLFARSVHKAPGDSIWLTTEKLSSFQNYGGPAIIKLDSAGQVAWARHYWHAQFNLFPDGSVPAKDSGLVIYGVYNSSPAEAFLLKLDAQGNQQWFYTIPNLVISDIAERSNGNIRYVGTDFNLNPGLMYGELVPGSASACATLRLLTDTIFTPLVYPDTTVIPIPINRTPATHLAIHVNATDSVVCNGLVGIPDAAANDPLPAFELIPNPAGESVRISGLHGQNTIRLYNSRGQLCMSQVTQNDAQWLDVSQFAEGLYFITIDNGEKRSAQKLVIQR